MRWLFNGLLLALLSLAYGPIRAWQATGGVAGGRDLKLEVAELPASGKRWALLIGIGDYRDKNISGLPGAVNDAKALADTLIKYAAFPKDQVFLLTTESREEQQPTRVNILHRLSSLAQVVPKDGLLLLSFSGHGISRGSDAYLITTDGRLSGDVRFLAETAVGVARIREWIRDSGIGQILLLIDACRNEPTGRSGAGNVYTENYKGLRFDVANREVKAFATLFAADLGQRAFEFAEKNQGYFSWAVVEGLRGAAMNSRGEVTLAGLKRYVEETVARKTLVDLGPESQQRPIAWIEGFRAEELVLSAPGATKGDVPEPDAPEPPVPETFSRSSLFPTEPQPGAARKNDDGLTYS